MPSFNNFGHQDGLQFVFWNLIKVWIIAKRHCAQNWAWPSATVSGAQTDHAWRAFGQHPGCDCHRWVAVPADRCQLPPDSTRRTCSRHPCATPLADARTLASHARQLHGCPPPEGDAVGQHCRLAATSTPRAAHAATARAPYPFAIGPEEKPFTPLPTVTVELPPLRSSSPSSPFPSHCRPPPLVLLEPHPPHP
jgi:hypothetical protein